MKKEILEKNVNSILKYNPYVSGVLKEIDFQDISEIYEQKSEEGDNVVYFGNGDNKYLLHSKYDTSAEAKRLVKNIDFNRDSLIIVFGLGLGYHLLELKDKISEDTRVIIIEHNINVLKYALTHVDLSQIFDIPKFLLVFGNEKQIDELIIYQTGTNIYNLVQNTQVLILPNYHVYDKENHRVTKEIVKIFTSKLIAYGNDLEDIFSGFRNNYKNVDAFLEGNGINEIKDKYKGFPAIVVASGPSLDKNICHLKSAYGKALIISCDASLRACENNGVKPDAVASIERDDPTYKFYYENRTFDEDLVLVGPGLLWPKIFEEFPGKKIMMAKRHDGVEGWWYNHFENLEFVNQGQSAATVAFAVAQAAGCNPIILIGQDLAYTYGKKHSDSTHTEYEGDNNDEESDDVYVEDCEGNLIRSHFIYMLFKNWYEHKISMHPDLEVIDATEGGAYIKGTKVMTLEKAIESYCQNSLEKPLVRHLRDIVITEEEKYKKYKEIIENIYIEIEKFKIIEENAEEHYNRLENIEKKYDISKCNDEQLEDIVMKMQKGDSIIQDILYSNDTIKTFYQQIITQTIIYVKKIGNELTAENLIRNIELQKNLMYIIKNTTKVIIKEYEKAKDFIANEKLNKGECNGK